MNNKKKKQKQSKSSSKNFIKKIEKYLIDDQKLLLKYGLQAFPIISFPRRRRMPLLSKIAIWILRIQGGIFDTRYSKIER